MTTDVSFGLESATEVPGEKFFRLGVKMKLVLGPLEAMAFVAVDHVFHRLVRLAHCFHDLFAFLDNHTNIIGAMRDQERRLDPVDKE